VQEGVDHRVLAWLSMRATRADREPTGSRPGLQRGRGRGGAAARAAVI
jgi:hypothetical protein